jgi:hypothetical protein
MMSEPKMVSICSAARIMKRIDAPVHVPYT